MYTNIYLSFISSNLVLDAILFHSFLSSKSTGSKTVFTFLSIKPCIIFFPVFSLTNKLENRFKYFIYIDLNSSGIEFAPKLAA